MRGHFSPKIPVALLDRVLSGEGTPDDRQTVLRLLTGSGAPAEHPASVLRRLQTANDAGAPSDEQLRRATRALRAAVIAEAAYEANGAHAPHAIPAPESRHPSVRVPARQIVARPSIWRSRPLQLTLGAILSVGLVVVAKTEPWAHAVRGTPASQPVREYVTRRAQRATLDLPDGSRVVLAPDSRLRFATDARGARTVELQGQAYFTVVHDPARPFAVRTGAVETRVLGTSFAVRAYATDRVTQVVVADGKVEFGVGTSSAVLLPGDVGRIAPHQAPTVTRDTKTGDAFGWLHGQIGFDDVPLGDAIVELERLYDLDIRLADTKLAKRSVNMPATNQSASAVLETITLAVGATYTQHGRNVVLSAK